MTKKPKPHKIGKGGNPRPAKHINPAVRPDDGRLAAVPTVNFNVRLPEPILMQIKEMAYDMETSAADVIRNGLASYLDGQKELAKGVISAINIAVEFGGYDGAHHKDWVIDQMVRALAGDEYAKIVNDATEGNPEQWEVGIAP